MIKTMVIKENQTLFDLSLQLYGNIESAFKIIQDNDIKHLHDNKLVGKTISYEEQKIDLTNYFSVNGKIITTGLPVIGDVASFLMNEDSEEILTEDGFEIIIE